jgi:hypothetical protein
LAVMALGAVIASGAQAESAPFFSIGGTRLAAGKTHNIAAKGIKPFELITASNGSNITCQKLTVEKGVLLGSEPGTQGKVDQISKFTECKLVSGNGAPNCHLAKTEKGEETTTLETVPLTGELVENVVEKTKGGNQLLEVYSPTTGTTFLTIFFEGEGCELFVTKVTGKTAAEILTDPGEAKIELPGPVAEGTSFITKFPEARITEVWLVSGGTGKVVKVEQQTFANASTQHGTALITLANSKFEAENAKWSPLP